jgi:iron complex outermembrane receptor protein
MVTSRNVSVRLATHAWPPLLLLAAAGWPASAAHAQAAASPSELSEIVVTARKRTETVQDAPLSVQAFTATQLEDRGVQNMADLAKYTPGLTFTAGNSRAAADFSIRGMTNSYPPGDNRRDLVTIFIDGVPYIGNPSVLGSEDLERIEVIKGPQSALFGRATFGGAISMITTTPGDTLKGRVAVTAGQYGDYRVNGAIEGPIVPGLLAARLTVDGSEFDGFYRNALGGRLGESSQRYYSGTLNFTPTEDLSVKVRYGLRADEDGPAATALIARWPEHNCGPFPGAQPRALAGLPPGFTLAQARRAFCGELKAPSGPVGINTTLPAASVGRIPLTEHGTHIDHTLWSGNLDWRFAGGHTFTAIASTQRNTVRQLSDFERTAEDRYQAYVDINQTQDTYELRVASPAEQRLQWMIGVSRLEATFNNLGVFINGALFGATAGGPPLPLNPARNSSKTDSVYGSLGFDVTPQLNVSIEARHQKDIITSGIGTPVEFDVETPATLPRALVRYKLNDETNLYANYARGNQPTQGYATYFQLTPAQQAVASANGVNPTAAEAIVKNYEIGLKHRETDGAWYANVSIYYLEWIGRQGVRSVQVDLNGDGVITNLPAPAGENFNAVPFPAGDSNTRGVEIDGAFRVARNVSIGGSFAYADTEITKALNEPIPFRLFGITDSKGRLYGNAPKTTGAVFAQYDGTWSGEGTWFLRGDTTYIGKRYDNIVNLAYVPAQIRTNLRAGLASGAWDLQVWVNNVFDDDTLEAGRYNSDSAADPFFFQLVASEAVLPNKRQFGVTASYRF